MATRPVVSPAIRSGLLLTAISIWSSVFPIAESVLVAL